MSMQERFLEMMRPYRTLGPGELLHIFAEEGGKLCGADRRTVGCMQVSDATCEPCLDIFNEGIVKELGLGK